MKHHKWTEEDDSKLRKAIEDCEPMFDHFKQNSGYTDLNVWDAVAGRLLPEICVTGSACKSRWDRLKSEKDSWKVVSDAVNAYERDLAETTFDGVAELLGIVDALHDKMSLLDKKIEKLLNMWED